MFLFQTQGRARRARTTWPRNRALNSDTMQRRCQGLGMYICWASADGRSIVTRRRRRSTHARRQQPAAFEKAGRRRHKAVKMPPFRFTSPPAPVPCPRTASPSSVTAVLSPREGKQACSLRGALRHEAEQGLVGFEGADGPADGAVLTRRTPYRRVVR